VVRASVREEGCYFASYFNAWLDNQNLYTGPKKVVTGFTPRLAMDPGNRDKVFAAYPDGTLIAIVREPHAWYESAVKYRRSRAVRDPREADRFLARRRDRRARDPARRRSLRPRGGCLGLVRRLQTFHRELAVSDAALLGRCAAGDRESGRCSAASSSGTFPVERYERPH
jgi:hypothetical protein